MTVTYESVLSTVETIDSGRASIGLDTELLSSNDQTASILLKVPLGAAPPPGGTPNFTSTAEILQPAIVDGDNDGIADTAPPTNKDQCKQNGWRSFNNPSFSNQGRCVSYVNAT